MQKGVLIKDEAGNIIDKRVYAGDLDVVEDLLNKEGVIFEIFDDTEQVFVFSEVKEPVSASREPIIAEESKVAEWKSKVTIEDKVEFLAQSLGFK